MDSIANSALGKFIDKVISEVFVPAMMVLFTLAVLIFFWGLFEFMADPTNADKRKTGLNHMLWGIIGLVIMSTVYGILNLIAGTLGVQLPVFGK